MSSTHQARSSRIPNSALYRLAADSVYEFSIVISARGTISFINDILLNSTLHRPEGLRGKPLSALIRKPDGKAFAPSFLRPRSRSNPQRKNFSIVTRDGRSFTCRGKVYFFAGRGREPSGVLVLGNRVKIKPALWGDVLADRAHAKTLLASVRDGLCVVDAKGIIISANPALAGMARLHPGDMIGIAPPYPWLGKEENLRLAGALAGVVRTGAPAHLLVVLERDDDRPFALSFAISPLHEVTGLFLASVRDISDVHPVQENQMAGKRIERLKEQVHRNAVRLETLQEINSSVLRSGSLRTIFKRISEGIGRLVDHDLAGVYVFEGDEKILRPHTVSKLTPFSRRLGKLPLTLGEGIVGSAAISGETVMVNNAQQDPRSVYPPGMKPEIEHIIAAPLRGRQSTYGILAVARNRHPGFHEEDAQIVQSFADAASIAIENLRLYGDPGLPPGRSRRAATGFRSPAAPRDALSSGRRGHSPPDTQPPGAPADADITVMPDPGATVNPDPHPDPGKGRSR
ncbi:MAG TPA: GAF domain-containing protein [Bacteroidota bacterium]|nr:GAF domain-containing protein [Bacteroidota bacterium]